MKKVLVGGTFDLIHPGHLWFLKRSKQEGDHLIVVVARDKTVKRRKGRPPVIPEKQRLELIKGLQIVDKAVLGDENDFINTIKKVEPDVVVLGHDQNISDEIRECLLKEGAEVIHLQKKLDGGLLDSSGILKKIMQEFG